VLGIDIGTSATKTILCKISGEIIQSASSPYPLYQPHKGWAEQPPDDWWEATIASIREVLHHSGIQPSDIVSIGLTGQMHGAVFLDKYHQVIRPAIIWCDQRTESQVSWLEEQVGYEQIIQYTANPPLTNFTLTKLLWLKENEPQHYEKTAKLLLPKDYISFKLTGQFTTDVSDASGTLLLDVRNRQWSDPMINRLQISRDWLPSLYESQEICGEVTEEAEALTGLKKGTPVVAGAGDQAAGAIGNGIVNTGVVSVSVGTSGVVFASTDQPEFDHKGRLHTFCHAVPDKWHVMGVTQAAAGSLEWFVNEFFQEQKREMGKSFYDKLLAETEKISPTSDGLLFLPYLFGERTPHLDPHAKGTFFGLTSYHTRLHFVRAILEGVAYSLRDCLSLIQQLGISVHDIRMSGGGAKGPLWNQIHADIFNHRVTTINASEGPAFGAAILSMVGVREYATVEEACDELIYSIEETQPIQENITLYEKEYTKYQALYPSLKKIFMK
jgi:xylulokinase